MVKVPVIVAGIFIAAFLLFSFKKKTDDCNSPRWIQGEEYLYSYENELIAFSDIQKLYSNDTSAERRSFFGNENLQELKMQLTANVKQTILQANEYGCVASFETHLVNIEMKSKQNLIDISAIKKEIQKPVIVTYTADGHMTTIRTDSSISFSSERFVKDILGHFQFVRNTMDKPNWITTEENINGTYEARYKLLNGNDASRDYEKIRTGYLHLISAGKGQQIRVESIGKISTDSCGTLKTIEVSETECTVLKNDTISAGGSRYSIILVSHQTASSVSLNSLSGLEMSPLYSRPSSLHAVHSAQQIRELAYSHTLNTDSFESLVKKLAFRLDSASLDNLILQFRALAYLQPGECAKMGELLTNSKRGTQTYKVLLTALAQTETYSSIDVLAAVLNKRRTEKQVVMDFLPVFALTKSPTKKAVEIIYEMAFENTGNHEPYSSAQLALGGLAYNLRKTDALECARLTEALFISKELGKDTVHKILCLANTGAESNFPFLKNLATDITLSATIRSHAVYSVKLIESDSIHPFLLQMQNDRDSIVSKSAIDAIKFRREYLGYN